MGLNALEIFKLLPKTNCKKCGFPTCLAFAMQLAMGKVSLDKCPDVSEESRAKLQESSAPPIKTVTIGKGESELKLGGEIVLFRHEKTFYSPTGIGTTISEDMSEEEIEERINRLKTLEYERVGLSLKADLVAVEDRGKGKFLELAQKALSTKKAVILASKSPANLEKVLKELSDFCPLVYAATEENFASMAKLAKEFRIPLAVKAEGIEKLIPLIEKIKQMGVENLVLDTGANDIKTLFRDMVSLRRASILKKFRTLGYPTISFTGRLTDDYLKEALYASILIAKYSSAVVMNHIAGETLFPLLIERLNIFTDPQRPMATPEGIYEIGKPDENSPVIVTVNFALSYFIVSGEVENSRTPAWLLVQDSEGLSVLTAWAADKFNAETIAALVKKTKIEEKIKHRKLIIPGYVAQIVGELEEELPGWEILLGPREASYIPAFLKSSWKAA